MRAGVILSYVIEAVNILSGLIYTPIMLSILGKNEYGLYQLVCSVVAYLSLIGLGFSSSYQRYYAHAKNESDEKVSQLNGMFLTVFLAMSFVCILAGTVMVFNAGAIFGDKLTTGEIAKSKILLGIMIFNMALTFPNSLFTSYITAHKKFIFQRVVILLERLFNPFIGVPLLLLGYGSVGLVSVTTFLSVFGFLLNVLFSVRKLKIKISIKNFDLRKIKEIWGFTFFIFLNQIVNQINWGVDKYLLGRYYGTAVVAVYSIGGQLRGYFSQFSSSISNVFIPRVNEIVSKTSDNKELNTIFTSVGKTQAYVVFLIVSGFYLFGKKFIYLWAGPEYNESYYIALMLMLVLVVPYVQNLGIEIQRAKNKHRVRSVVYVFMAFLNVALSIPLIKLYGATGAAIGTVISIFLCNIVFMNFYYHCYIGLDVISFWKEILRIVPGLILPMAVGLLIRNFKVSNMFGLFFQIILYTAVFGISMILFGMTKQQRQSVMNRFYKRKTYN